MLPRVDLVARQAMEAAVIARAADRKKKRLAVFELKRIRRGPRDDLVWDSLQRELATTPAGSRGVVPLAIPLIEAGSSRPVRLEPFESHPSESARERI